MEVKIQYNQYEKRVKDVDSYQDLVKAIRQSFKYLLKNKFSIFYFDEDQDKITISNQEDFEAIRELESIQIIVEENENAGQLSDDSFQKLDKSVQETVNQFRKLSSSLNNQETKNEQSDSPQRISSPEQIQEEKSSKQQAQQESDEKKRAKIIADLEATIKHLKQEIIKTENDETVKKFQQKLQNLVEPQIKLKPMFEDLQEMEIMKAIYEAEQKFLTLNKVQREDLRKNYKILHRQIGSLITKRQTTAQTFLVDSKDYLRSKQKYEKEIAKAQKRGEKNLHKIKKLLKDHEQKLQDVINNKCNLQKIDYLSKEQVEKQLDELMKKELKEQKKKQDKKVVVVEQPQEISQQDDVISQDSFSDID